MSPLAPDWSKIPATGPLMRPEAAADYLSISRTRLYVLSKQGVLPPLLKIGGRATGMSKPQIDAMICARAATVGGGRK